MWISSNYSNKEHLAKRKLATLAALSDTKLLGFNKPQINIGLRKLIFNTYIRSRMTYALENSHLTQTDIDELETLEAKIIKKSLGIGQNSYNTEIFAAMRLKTFSQAYEIRQIRFLNQLVENRLTAQIILLNLEGSPINKTLDKIGQLRIMSHANFEAKNKLYSVTRACKESETKIHNEIKSIEERELTKNIRYLLENYNDENQSILKIIADSQNGLRNRDG